MGSPTSSPVSSGNLPGFLMGDTAMKQQTTFSPTKKTLSFATSPTGHQITSPELNMSNMTSPMAGGPGPSRLFKYPNMHDTSATAPPTISLFDSLREERNQTPSKVPAGQSVVDGTLNASGMNASRVMSPMQNTSVFDSTMQRSRIPYNNFWVTVFGFPATSISTILSHFSQCGTIVDKSFPPQNGNWIHLRFSSRMECDKAINYNGKVIANSLMIGVLPCTDTSVTNEEVLENREPAKLRSLSRVTYETSQSPTAVEPNVFAPKLNTGIVSKAMDMFFGW